MPDYQTTLGVALIVLGAVLLCGALILRRREQTESPDADDEDAGELAALVDTLRRTDNEVDVRSRIDRTRK